MSIRRALDVGFDHEVARPADEDEMLDLVATQDEEPAMRIEVERFDNGEPSLPQRDLGTAPAFRSPMEDDGYRDEDCSDHEQGTEVEELVE
jgi:hypothetical protein